MAHCFCKRNYLWFRVNAARVSVKFRVIAAYLVENVSAPKTKNGLQNNLSALCISGFAKRHASSSLPYNCPQRKKI